MRVVKLSKEEFSELEDVRRFFRNLLKRNPPGKFRITKGRIAKNALEPGEKILFSYSRRVYFIAQSASSRLKNEDKYQNKYPSYFLLDMDTLHPVDISLFDVEKRYHQETGETKHLVQAQGWPIIENETFATSLWESLI